MENKLKMILADQNPLFKLSNRFIGLILLLVLFISCDSEDRSSDDEFSASLIDTEQEIAEVDDTAESINEIVESAFLEILSTTLFKSSDYKSNYDKRFLSDCVDISKTPKDGYIEIILDYGEGCTTKKNHFAKGKINIRAEGSITNSTMTITYTFDNFYINDKKIEGTVEKQRMRSNENGNPQAQITRNMTMIWEDNSSSSIEGQRTREWIKGTHNELWGDNEFSITGNWTISRRNGKVYSSTIVEPLIRTMACRFTVAGIIEIESQEERSQLNFGDGECDDLATITKNGKSYQIHIRKRKGK